MLSLMSYEIPSLITIPLLFSFHSSSLVIFFVSFITFSIETAPRQIDKRYQESGLEFGNERDIFCFL